MAAMLPETHNSLEFTLGSGENLPIEILRLCYLALGDMRGALMRVTPSPPSWATASGHAVSGNGGSGPLMPHPTSPPAASARHLTASPHPGVLAVKLPAEEQFAGSLPTVN